MSNEMHLSPEALESLAMSVAAKLENQINSTRHTADEMVRFQEVDRKFKEEDLAFKKQVGDSLASLQRQRTMLPYVATATAILAILMSIVTMAGTAQAISKLSMDISEQRILINRFHPDGK